MCILHQYNHIPSSNSLPPPWQGYVFIVVRCPGLLLAKISLKFCKYVRLTVCLSVCLFVCLFVCNIHDTGRTVQAINTKLGTYMYLGSGYRCILFGVDDIIDDVIKFKNRSNFEIAITPSIFEIERWSKAQNVALGIVHVSITRHDLISF